MIYIILFFQILIGAAHAQSSIIFDLKNFTEESPDYGLYYLNPKNLPTVNFQNNQVTIDFHDGRVGMVSMYAQLVKDLKTPIKFTEFTCLELDRLTQCDYYQDIALYSYRLVWKNHPDSQKQGTIIEFTPSDTNQFARLFEKNLTWSYEDNFISYPWILDHLNSTLKKNVLKPRLKCQDLRWFQELSFKYGQSGQGLYINEWTEEDMRENTETNINVNQVTQSSLGVTLKKENQTIYLSNIKHLALPRFQSTAMIVNDDILGWNLLSQGDSCDVQINADTSFLDSSIQKIMNDINHHKFLTPALMSKETFAMLSDFNNSTTLNDIKDWPMYRDQIYALSRLGLINVDFNQKEFPLYGKEGNKLKKLNLISVREVQ